MSSYTKEELKRLVITCLKEMSTEEIPVGISNRHIHLCAADFQQLFPNETLEPLKMLKQPGEFAAKQTVTIIGEKGHQEKVRILGPLRKKTQVEISKTDARILGIDAPIKLSGQLENAGLVTLKSKATSLELPVAIVAKRHIHMNSQDLKRFNVQANDNVTVKVKTPERTTIFEDVVIRFGENFVLEMHIDTDEANAANVSNETKVVIV